MLVKELIEQLQKMPQDMEVGLEYYSKEQEGYYFDSDVDLKTRKVFATGRIHFGEDGGMLKDVLTLL